MHDDRTGQVAVIFRSHRTAADEAGYAEAAATMESLAARQPGYRGMDSVHDAGGTGITISYWADQAAAIAWRDQPDHAAARELGRARWYDDYDIAVAIVERSYGWSRP
ncbi:MAG TPA: antibiotic biosynthesis monooxygenase [Sphingomonas sp.]|jgi:heme-degrading monooxygenase HmoA|nr:antibiotic biosynthesis monooxygenase [Sphingomonas sp.]